MFRFMTASAVAMAALAGQAQAETYSATGVDVVHAAAQLFVIAEDRGDVAVDIVNSDRVPEVGARLEGGRLVLDGGLGSRIHGCSSGNFLGAPAAETVNIWGGGQVRKEDLPRITLRVPRRMDLTAGGAIFGAIGASAGGRVRISGCGKVTMGGASGDLDLVQSGSGDLDVGMIDGPLRARLDGSGDLRIGAAHAGANVDLNGSGDVHVGDMSGLLTASLDGSGGLNVGNGAQGGELSLNGSGDVRVGAMSGPLRARLDGSGGLSVVSVQGGAVDLSLMGSGDLVIRGGVADQLTARLQGSGELRFAGRAQALDADLGGSGDIEIADAGETRHIRDHGSGDVRVGR